VRSGWLDKFDFFAGTINLCCYYGFVWDFLSPNFHSPLQIGCPRQVISAIIRVAKIREFSAFSSFGISL